MKPKKIALVALSIAINIIGSKLAIVFSLPIFLDSIGTVLAGAVMGPWYGLLTALAGGLVNGALGDVYSIYFAPSGMVVGLLAGVFLYNKNVTKRSIPFRTLGISAPGSFVASLISTYLFGGITSAAVTTAITQALSKTLTSLFTSVFLTQLVTDYVDKLVAVILVMVVIKRLPYNMTHFEKE